MRVRDAAARIRSPRGRRLLHICLVLWAVYLVAVNVFINTGLLPRLAAPIPERTKLSWDRAWTLVPGVVHVRGFKLWKHTRGTVWSLEADLRVRTR